VEEGKNSLGSYLMQNKIAAKFAAIHAAAACERESRAQRERTEREEREEREREDKV
jgi:ribosomal protein L12E/L44/L45/RPP1/RPP2